MFCSLPSGSLVHERDLRYILKLNHCELRQMQLQSSFAPTASFFSALISLCVALGTTIPGKKCTDTRYKQTQSKPIFTPQIIILPEAFILVVCLHYRHSYLSTFTGHTLLEIEIKASPTVSDQQASILFSAFHQNQKRICTMNATNGNNNQTYPVSVYGTSAGENANNNTYDDDMEGDVRCGARCWSEWGRSFGWFSLQDAPNKTLDIAASFGPTSLGARFYKVVYMVWMISTLIGKWYRQRDTPWFFLAYLTHWALILATLWSMLSLFNSFWLLPQPASPNESVSIRTKISWLLYPMAANMSAIVTVLFWTVEFDYSGAAPSYWQLMTHGGSCLLTWFEGLAVNRIPMRWKHVLPIMGLGAVYIAWTIIHQLATEIGNPRRSDTDPETNDDLIYGVLDFKENTGFSVILVVVVVFVVIPLLHWSLWALSLYQFPCGGCRGANRRYLSTTAEAGNGSKQPSITNGSDKQYTDEEQP